MSETQSQGKRKPAQGEVYSIFKKRKTLDDDDKGSTAGAMDETAIAEKLSAFKTMLDFTTITTEEEINERLDAISKILLHELRLVVRREKAQDLELQILEAEFYLQIGGCHEDPFTHGSEEQKVSGRWYFHRAPRFSQDSHRSSTSLTEYRSGSRKGMDLTFGGAPQPTTETRRLRGGILLRSVRNVATKKVTSGPSLLVDLILNASGVTDIKDLVDVEWDKNTSAFASDLGKDQTTRLFLKPVPTTGKNLPTLYHSPRIGLELSHPGTTSATILPLHPRIQFLPKKYRFFTHPELLVANGRAQTFLGVLNSIIPPSDSSSSSDSTPALHRPSLSKDISRITGTKEVTASKYLADYNPGRVAGTAFLDSVIGAKGKGASSSPATYLKMMGGISTLS